MIRYKIDVLLALKNAGWTTYKIRKEKLVGESAMQRIREGELPSWGALDVICSLLHCQPGDIVEYVDAPNEPAKTE